jgi:hypothetical protein
MLMEPSATAAAVGDAAPPRAVRARGGNSACDADNLGWPALALAGARGRLDG